METFNTAQNLLLGVAVADALGVPVEFQSREQLLQNPVTNMREYGTYHQPRGTWSDDTSLTLCLMESLLNGLDLNDIAYHFINWENHAHWTPHDEVFDIGNTTSESIYKLSKLISKGSELQWADLVSTDEQTNGNGSLMRILPLLALTQGKSPKDNFQLVWNVSALTHGHIRASIACLIYLTYADKISKGKDKFAAYHEMQTEIINFFLEERIANKEQEHFARLIKNDIATLNESDIQSLGYVIHSLEASFWCILNNDTYASTVLAAVNLGGDTDTTAAIAGGIAGLLYGVENIPNDWLDALVRKNDLIDLANQFEEKYFNLVK